ncbi:MAG: CHAT domain-containing protein, partial [Pyrinomonadaceae bacterium]
VAVRAARAAWRLEQYPPALLGEDERLVLAPPHIRTLEGGRWNRPSLPYGSDWWRRIKITSVVDPETGEATGDLGYIALTDRARAEATLQQTDREVVDDLVRDAIGEPEYDEELAVTLFQQLLPNDLKDQAQVEADLVLLVDKLSARYPWELLAQPVQGGRTQPLAERMGILRQFVTSQYRTAPRPAHGKTALVVGVSRELTIGDDFFPPLPGVEDETRAVARLLKDGDYDSGEPLLNASYRTVFGKLTKGYRILHLAAHGVVQHHGRTGVVLSERHVLSAAQVETWQHVPDLVFVNCCHLGRTDIEAPTPAGTERRPFDPQINLLAASFAEALIKQGVKAVVVAGWAVDDAAATAFATYFYGQMIAGETFGEAVKYARQQTLDQFGKSTNTWGAYQCYGNPGFVLSREGGTAARDLPRFYSPQEYVEALKTLEGETAHSGGQRLAEIRRQLREMDTSLPPGWRDGFVLAAFGDTWAAAGDFEAAIECYREAIREEKSAAPLKAVEQFANLISRHLAAQTERFYEKRDRTGDDDAAEPPDPVKSAEMIEEALERLAWASKLGETDERLSLFGGAYRRLAFAADEGTKRDEYLKSAVQHYGRAHERNAARLAVNFYPALN